MYGISGTALKLIESYFHDRSQCVNIKDETPTPLGLKFGVPQGSVLGPQLFTYYTSPLEEIITHGLKGMIYADDTQLYV